jgi:hypothetical protein
MKIKKDIPEKDLEDGCYYTIFKAGELGPEEDVGLFISRLRRFKLIGRNEYIYSSYVNIRGKLEQSLWW